ncbi:phosphoribosylanthranilate isomerase [Methylophilaceae bacterium]|nr:phosphoribosylanthranilate isomerase [Methylophilaceae bacterium]
MITKVKFCGITNLKDAISAAELGADALGFVFYPKSPRFISPKNANEIIKKLPPFISMVGLFVNQSKSEVEEVIKGCPLNLLQFHGDENESFCKQYNLPYIKAITMKSDVDLLKCIQEYNSAKALLLDTFSKVARGGSGEVFDWKMIPPNTLKPIIVAGGLTPDNVQTLLEVISPYGVDVSSGIEINKGLKDYKLMKKFILGVTNAGV